MPSVHRVIVGASGSPGSLWALRYAEHLARDLDATLVPVLAWMPLDSHRLPWPELRQIWHDDADS